MIKHFEVILGWLSARKLYYQHAGIIRVGNGDIIPALQLVCVCVCMCVREGSSCLQGVSYPYIYMIFGLLSYTGVLMVVMVVVGASGGAGKLVIDLLLQECDKEEQILRNSNERRSV